MKSKSPLLRQQLLLRQARTLHHAGKISQAKELYRQLLKYQPGNADVLYLLGTVEFLLGNLEESVNLLGKSLEISPDNPRAHNNRGNALKSLGRLEEALASYDLVVALMPSHAEVHHNRGMVLQKLNRQQDALACYDKALSLNPEYAEAHNNRGTVLKDLQSQEAALASYDKVLELKPNHAEAHCNRGDVLQKLKRFEQALASYDKALAIKPDYATAINNRGIALYELKRLPEALICYDKAISINPEFYAAYNNRGLVCQKLNRPDEAIADFDKVLAIRPDHAEAYYNRGLALNGLNRREGALASFAKALAIKPDYDFLEGLLLHTQMHLCDWSQFDVKIDSLVRNISDGKKSSLPFIVLGLVDSCNVHKKCAEIYTSEMFCKTNNFQPVATHKVHEIIRIGYFSSDFRAHPVMHLMAEIFELHDRSRFETVAFSSGPETNDEWQRRARGSFDKFIDIRDMSDQEVVSLARKLEIDIAIDLNGHTQDSRTGIFAKRAAPIQVNYLGYPGTMGAGFIDYLIADPVTVPEGMQEFYSEKIACLPECCQPNCKYRDILSKMARRIDHGLPPDVFVFGSFNNNYKITPEIFNGWMHILRKVTNSVLWILTGNPAAENNLRKEAEARGVSASRLIFARKIPAEQHLGRLRLADLMLDTFPYGAHTTCSEALRMGLPVITMMGESFASRVAASLLTAVGLPELITTKQEEYTSLAIDLATYPEKLARIKESLAKNIMTSVLFDSERYARKLESVYVTMYERYQNNLPPERFSII